MQSVEASRTRTTVQEENAKVWAAPQQRPEGKPLIDMLPQPSLPSGVPTPSQGALERMLLPGALEAGFIQASMSVANIGQGWKAMSAWSSAGQQVMTVALTGTQEGLAMAATNTGRVRMPFPLWDRLSKGARAMATAEQVALSVEIPLAYEKVSAGAVGIWKDYSLAEKEAKAFGAWMGKHTPHVAADLATKPLAANLAITHDGLPPIVSWLRTLKPGQIKLRWAP
jgi:hypothetical protein